MRFALCTVFILPLLVAISSVAFASDIGFAKFSLVASGPDQRDLSGVIWYPSRDDTPEETIAENIVFHGEKARPGATPLPGSYPLVVLSHGFGGNWRNQAWLATELVRHGRIVAALNHPGTTSKDLQALDGRMLWKRPQDIAQLITYLTGHSDWSALLRTNDIAVIGHSLGAWTALAIAGARTDARRMLADCRNHADLAACDVVADFAIGHSKTDQQLLAQSLRITNVSRVVSLDLGLARGFTPESLSKIDIPVLLIAAGSPNPGIPHAIETGYLRPYLNAASTEFHLIEQAAHFSFMPRCKPGAARLLDDEVPGDGVVCRDGDGTPDDIRQIIHHQTARLIIDFLGRTH